MAIRYLEVTVRLDMGPDLTDEARRDIADDLRADLDSAIRQGILGTANHEPLDFTTVAEWTAKPTGR